MATAESAAFREDCVDGDGEKAGEEGGANGLEDVSESVESVELTDCDSMFQVMCSADRELTYGPWPFRTMDVPALGATEVAPAGTLPSSATGPASLARQDAAPCTT